MRTECALRDHPALVRYLRQTPSGRLHIDRSKIAGKERLDGKFLFFTSRPDLSAEDVALGYKNLLEAETQLPRPQDHTRAETRLSSPRAPHPRARTALLAGAAAAQGRRTPDRTDLAAHRARTSDACTSSRSPAPPARSRRPPSSPPPSASSMPPPAPSRRRGSPHYSPPERPPTPASPAWAHTHKLHKVPGSQLSSAIPTHPRHQQLRNSGVGTLGVRELAHEVLLGSRGSRAPFDDMEQVRVRRGWARLIAAVGCRRGGAGRAARRRSAGRPR
jgi:hypothetical protein